MKERPILFSGEMVQAILDGRKTQTRRVIKPQPRYGQNVTCTVCGQRKAPQGRSIPDATSASYCTHECKGYYTDPQPDYLFSTETDADFGYHWNPRCPYGIPGDRLWVRETWRTDKLGEGEYPVRKGQWIECRATPDIPPPTYPGRWRASIHMPRWASRIDLEITDIRVERVQEISPQDVCREGIRPTIPGGFEIDECDWIGAQQFKPLWDSINAKRGYGWGVNPWVWVISFRRIEP